MAKYIGIDLGGTQVRVAIVNEQGEILEDLIEKSNPALGREKVMELIFKMIDSLKGLKDVEAIGAGVPGPVVDGVMKISTNLLGFANYDIQSALSLRYNLPCFVDNDANVAGLAEALIGAGKNHKIVYYYTHSTGIGGALIIDGQLVSGTHGFAGEIANIIVDPKGETRNFLNKGAVENLAGGTSLYLRFKDQLEIESARDIFDLARNNNPKALEIMDEMVDYLSTMMSAIAHVVDPGCFVIGGGCSKAHDVYFDKLRLAYQAKVHKAMADIPIMRAQLKEPGVVGAAMLCVSKGQ